MRCRWSEVEKQSGESEGADRLENAGNKADERDAVQVWRDTRTQEGKDSNKNPENIKPT